jgi:hypothetical protein
MYLKGKAVCQCPLANDPGPLSRRAPQTKRDHKLEVGVTFTRFKFLALQVRSGQVYYSAEV